MMDLETLSAFLNTYLWFLPEELHLFVLIMGGVLVVGLGYKLFGLHIIWMVGLFFAIPIFLPWILPLFN